MTVRLEDDLFEELETVARVCGCSVTDVVRSAIGDFVAEQRDDADFRHELERLAAESQRRLSRFRPS